MYSSLLSFTVFKISMIVFQTPVTMVEHARMESTTTLVLVLRATLAGTVQ